MRSVRVVAGRKYKGLYETPQRGRRTARAAGLFRELNPGPLAPEARIIPLDQAAELPEYGSIVRRNYKWHVFCCGWLESRVAHAAQKEGGALSSLLRVAAGVAVRVATALLLVLLFVLVPVLVRGLGVALGVVVVCVWCCCCCCCCGSLLVWLSVLRRRCCFCCRLCWCWCWCCSLVGAPVPYEFVSAGRHWHVCWGYGVHAPHLTCDTLTECAPPCHAKEFVCHIVMTCLHMEAWTPRMQKQFPLRTCMGLLCRETCLGFLTAAWAGARPWHKTWRAPDVKGMGWVTRREGCSGN